MKPTVVEIPITLVIHLYEVPKTFNVEAFKKTVINHLDDVTDGRGALEVETFLALFKPARLASYSHSSEIHRRYPSLRGRMVSVDAHSQTSLLTAAADRACRRVTGYATFDFSPVPQKDQT